MGRPGRSTTVTETLKPISLHFSIAALAIVYAIAREIFRSVTRPCACAGDHSAVASAIAPRIFNVEDMELFLLVRDLWPARSGKRYDCQFKRNPGSCHSMAPRCPSCDRVTYAVRSSGPPKQRLVTPISGTG